MATAQLSNLLKVGIGSPTTKISASYITNTTSTINYTCPANGVPVRISIMYFASATGGSITVDGIVVPAPVSVPANFNYYLAPGQSTSIVLAAAASVSTGAIISANKVD